MIHVKGVYWNVEREICSALGVKLANNETKKMEYLLFCWQPALKKEAKQTDQR